MKFSTEHGQHQIDVDINEKESSFTINGESTSYEFERHNGRYYLRLGTILHTIDNVKIEGSLVEFSIDGNWYKVSVKDEEELLLDKLGFKSSSSVAEGSLISPMPGKILDVLVSIGDSVSKGDRVAILEAMKMENELKAPIDGTIISISVEVGESVEKKTPILEIE